MNDEIIGLDSHSEFEEFNLHEYFSYFNNLCFDGFLDVVCVSWSKKLTLSAGICSYEKEGYCNIRLSESLLRYRAVKECKEILLHEMIHAYLFLKKRNKKLYAHGKEFIWHMNRVNEITGLNVTIYHNFHDEVNYYRKHIWRCTGDCRLKSPHFGYIKRSKNIAPGPRDRWWKKHANTCGGTFVKLGEDTCDETKRVDRTLTLHKNTIDPSDNTIKVSSGTYDSPIII
ncbi:hypothetical protein BEWA_008050 [Theileria equi strain WA]|uniref:SprT-like domain-containing protein n=1 Tax=Theileria equi strain WA TaxID=1537102 RepID=L0B0S3_THEEQ|nr:hypothetical protein BEWA_008050 [Theileria equi strain WA]AFZ81395.1 hypothetical protein BEWA_008050 [Theileria equi strain WA]|eukprot:XP_004831061.1 hypothetical protein BEWA_008050 [Theileria equi strain WA]